MSRFETGLTSMAGCKPIFYSASLPEPSTFSCFVAVCCVPGLWRMCRPSDGSVDNAHKHGRYVARQ
ncbi:MAG: hypothetical protein QOJ99_5566 [Bryobacterales bacterium]|jgi:hypothetical protein|nr:hypothetical protein [Bryobacterales bacterium]